jgi:hypothetical protein
VWSGSHNVRIRFRQTKEDGKDGSSLPFLLTKFQYSERCLLLSYYLYTRSNRTRSPPPLDNAISSLPPPPFVCALPPNVSAMSGKYVFSRGLKELRFLHCQTSEHSNAVRYETSHTETTRSINGS